jgi:hypothetical protein
VKRRNLVQNTNIPKHASCLQEGIKVKLQKMWQRNVFYFLNPKRYVWGKSNTTHHLVPLFIFSSMMMAHVMDMLVVGKDLGLF